jgi:hypothetical protein
MATIKPIKIKKPLILYLDKFESEAMMEVGATVPPGMPAHAPYSENKAEIEVSLCTFLKTFKFQMDSFDINNCKKNDIKYFVFKEHFFSDPNLRMNPADAIIKHTDLFQTDDDKSITSYPTNYKENKKLLCHDFIRYLALKLFGTTHAVDLFDNETELLDDVRRQCFISQSDASLSTMNNIKNIMEMCDVSNELLDASHCSPSTDYDTIYGMSNKINTSDNICKMLFDQILGTDITRMAHLNRDDELQSLPLRDGDTIIYKMTIHAAENQHMLTEVDVIPPRIYEIRYVLRDTPNNINRSCDEIQNYKLYNFKTGLEYAESDDYDRTIIKHDFNLNLPSYMQHLFSLILDLKVLESSIFNNLTSEDILTTYTDVLTNNYLFDFNLSRRADTIIELDVEYDFEIYILDTTNAVVDATQFASSEMLFITDGPPDDIIPSDAILTTYELDDYSCNCDDNCDENCECACHENTTILI